MKLSRLKVLGNLFLAGILTVPAWAAKTAQPGSLNYVEGQVSIGDQPVNADSVGNVTLQSGQILSTGNGRAEVLLMPGVFLRVDNNSSVQMNSLGLIDTEVVVNEGRAMIEADQIHSQNNLRVIEGGMPTQIVKNGLYQFDAMEGKVLVYKGQARVLEGPGGEHVTIDGGHQADFNMQGKLKSEDFNKESYKNTDLYRWSSLRSSYLAEANVDAASTYYANGYYGPGWIGPGWYWDPWYSSYTFIPGDGFFYSPFGWGFYSPIVVFRSPVFFDRPRFVHHFGPGFDRDRFERRRGDFRGDGFHHGDGFHRGEGFRGDGFHGGSGFHGNEGFHGGGFHGGDGFHGGGSMHGGGGGFHGGGGGFHGGGGGAHGGGGGGHH
jgi:hypothetical protein